MVLSFERTARLPLLRVEVADLLEPRVALAPSVLEIGNLNLEIIEIPIGALGGQQIFKAKGVIS